MAASMISLLSSFSVIGVFRFNAKTQRRKDANSSRLGDAGPDFLTTAILILSSPPPRSGKVHLVSHRYPPSEAEVFLADFSLFVPAIFILTRSAAVSSRPAAACPHKASRSYVPMRCGWCFAHGRAPQNENRCGEDPERVRGRQPEKAKGGEKAETRGPRAERGPRPEGRSRRHPRWPCRLGGVEPSHRHNHGEMGLILRSEPSHRPSQGVTRAVTS
jgi:hypothetical protein